MVCHDPNGIPDDLIANGPTIISTASLDTLAGWFPGLTTAEARLRFRATLEIDGVPPFWEDQLFGAELRSVSPLSHRRSPLRRQLPLHPLPHPRAPSPHRQSTTSASRKSSPISVAPNFPPWSHAERFEHFYCVATNTRIPSTETNKPLKVGDPLFL